MSHVEQGVFTLTEYLSSPLAFSGVRVTRSLVFCVMFCRSLFFLLSNVVLYVLLVTPLVSSDFWLPLCYLLITPLVCSGYPFVIFRLLITPLLSSDYPFGIFWLPLCYLLITPLLSSVYPFVFFKLFFLWKFCFFFDNILIIITNDN